VTSPSCVADRAPAAQPKVSVVIPCREMGPPFFVLDAIRTVLAQTYEPVECIVVDDASDPPVTEVIGHVLARRVLVLRLDTRSERAHARNVGLERASGTHVVFLDHDDLLERRAVERLVGAQVATGADVVFGFKQLVAAATGAPFVVPERRGPRSAPRPMRWEDRLTRSDSFGVVALYRREGIGGLRFREDHVGPDDFLFALQAAMGRRVTLVPQVLYGYRDHATQSSKRVPSREIAERRRSGVEHLLATHQLPGTARRAVLGCQELWGDGYVAWTDGDAAGLVRSCRRAALVWPRVCTTAMWWKALLGAARLLAFHPSALKRPLPPASGVASPPGQDAGGGLEPTTALRKPPPGRCGRTISRAASLGREARQFRGARKQVAYAAGRLVNFGAGAEVALRLRLPDDVRSDPLEPLRTAVGGRLPPFELSTAANRAFGDLNVASQVANDYFRAPEAYPSPGGIVVDAGSNIGIYGVLVALIEPTARIHAFEPIASNDAAARENCRANQVAGRVVLNQCALGASAGTARLALTYGGRQGTLADDILLHVRSGGYEEVDVVPLDHYCDRAAIESVDLMKIDVEGHEVELLAGAQGILKRTRLVVLEWHSGSRLYDATQILRAAGLTRVEYCSDPPERPIGIAYFSRHSTRDRRAAS
jgi:FkbM family methyltransferase